LALWGKVRVLLTVFLVFGLPFGCVVFGGFWFWVKLADLQDECVAEDYFCLEDD